MINQADKETAARLTVELINSLNKVDDNDPECNNKTVALVTAVIIKAIIVERAACAKIADDFKCYCGVGDCYCPQNERIHDLILERGAP